MEKLVDIAEFRKAAVESVRADSGDGRALPTEKTFRSTGDLVTGFAFRKAKRLLPFKNALFTDSKGRLNVMLDEFGDIDKSLRNVRTLARDKGKPITAHIPISVSRDRPGFGYWKKIKGTRSNKELKEVTRDYRAVKGHIYGNFLTDPEVLRWIMSRQNGGLTAARRYESALSL